MKNIKKPKIGITLDRGEGSKTEFSEYPWYAVRENYIESISKFGGIPIILPHEIDLVDEYYNMIDGLVVTGGNFDIDPEYYGQKITSESVSTKDKRTAFEISIINKAIENNMPLLGICGGEQLLNVALGGSLIQDINEEIDQAIEHEQKIAKHLAYHDVDILKDSKLYEILHTNKLKVNSSHHQAVKELGRDLKISATSSDGIIEAIEHISNKFCIGVEWHPEYLINNCEENIFKELINNARNN